MDAPGGGLLLQLREGPTHPPPPGHFMPRDHARPPADGSAPPGVDKGLPGDCPLGPSAHCTAVREAVPCGGRNGPLASPRSGGKSPNRPNQHSTSCHTCPVAPQKYRARPRAFRRRLRPSRPLGTGYPKCLPPTTGWGLGYPIGLGHAQARFARVLPVPAAGLIPPRPRVPPLH